MSQHSKCACKESAFLVADRRDEDASNVSLRCCCGRFQVQALSTSKPPAIDVQHLARCAGTHLIQEIAAQERACFIIGQQRLHELATHRNIQRHFSDEAADLQQQNAYLERLCSLVAGQLSYIVGGARAEHQQLQADITLAQARARVLCFIPWYSTWRLCHLCALAALSQLCPFWS